MVRIDWFLLALAYSSMLVFGLLDNVRGPLFPDVLKDFALSDSRGSLFFFVTSAAALVNSVLSFSWMRWLAPVSAMRWFTLVQGSSLLVIGLSSTFESVLVGCALLGFSNGGLGIAVNVLTVRAASEGKRRQALAGVHGMYGISSLLAPVVAVLLARADFAWREIFLALALGPAAIAIQAFWPRRAKSPAAVASASPRDDRAPGAKRRSWEPALLFAGILATYVTAEVLVGTRLVLFARREAGYGEEGASLLLSLFFLLLFVGRLLFALVHFPARNPVILATSSLVSAGTFALGIVVSPVWLAVSGLTMSMFYPCAISYLNDELGERAGFALSASLTVQSLCLTSMHLLVGGLSDRFGLGKALWIGPACLILTVVFLFAFDRRSRRWAAGV